MTRLIDALQWILVAVFLLAATLVLVLVLLVTFAVPLAIAALVFAAAWWLVQQV